MEQSSAGILNESKANIFFRKRHTNTVSFIVGILLFLLPFAELKCGEVTLLRNTGVGLATGTPWKTSMGTGSNEYMEKFKNPTDKSAKEILSGGVDFFAILALVFALVGVAICFSFHRMRSMAALSTGILAALMLIALLVQYKIAVNSALNNSNELKDFDLGKMLKLKFTFWYFLSLASFIAAAFFSYRHSRIELEDAMTKSVNFDFQEKAV